VRHLPNLICLLRIALIWPVVMAMAEGAYPRALLLFFVAALSDGLDGFLAKRFNWTSDLGKFLDPAADKLLLIAVLLVGTWYGLIPYALTGIAVARDVMIALGALIYTLSFGALNGRALWSSKLNTLMQVLYLIGVVAHAALGLPPARVLHILGIAMLLTVLVSGYVYAAVFMRRALQVARA
jgi:cardiolipin synthase (CMP-forming)